MTSVDNSSINCDISDYDIIEVITEDEAEQDDNDCNDLIEEDVFDVKELELEQVKDVIKSMCVYNKYFA